MNARDAAPVPGADAHLGPGASHSDKINKHVQRPKVGWRQDDC